MSQFFPIAPEIPLDNAGFPAHIIGCNAEVTALSFGTPAF
jgi:hypothetical protein